MRDHKGQSIIALPLNYIIIDTETTGLDPSAHNIIEVSAIKYENGKLVDTFTSLVKPPLIYTIYPLRPDGARQLRQYYVDECITDLTGITNEMLEHAPSPDEVMPKLLEFLGNSVLIAHNAHFDINFLYDAIETHCHTYLTNNFIDTVRIARKVFPDLGHHKLSDIAKACNVSQPNAHRSEVDCLVTNQCYEYMRNKILSSQSEYEFKRSFDRKPSFHSHFPESRKSVKDYMPRHTEIDKTNPLYQKCVVFTGSLSSLSRENAIQIAVDKGAVVKGSVSSKTDILVVGVQDISIVGSDGMSTKEEKAHEINQSGKGRINIISEDEFLVLAQIRRTITSC